MLGDGEVLAQKEQTGTEVDERDAPAEPGCRVKEKDALPELSTSDKSESAICKPGLAASIRPETGSPRPGMETSVGVSRRRLLFKSRAVAAATAATILSQNPSNKTVGTTAATADAPSTSTASSLPTSAKIQRKWEQWGPVEVKIFYEGLKQVSDLSFTRVNY